MTEPDRYRARIAPVDADERRPLWSVMIPTYNCASYLRQTLQSVLAQDMGSDLMQIEVIDDCSTRDDPRQVVEELGCGRVGFYRQHRNVGHVANFNTCIERARGRLVHILHGDDCVRPGFYCAMQRAFERHPEIGNAFCRHIVMDEDGNWIAIAGMLQDRSGVVSDWLSTIVSGQRLQTPCMVVRREVYEELGGFDSRVAAYGEDWEMWVRIATRYPVWFEAEPLALYRVHQRSLSGRTVTTGDNMKDMARVIEIIAGYLPPEQAANLRKAHENNALGALRRAHRAIDAGNAPAGRAQLVAALKTSRSPHVLPRAAFVSLRLLLARIRT